MTFRFKPGFVAISTGSKQEISENYFHGGVHLTRSIPRTYSSKIFSKEDYPSLVHGLRLYKKRLPLPRKPLARCASHSSVSFTESVSKLDIRRSGHWATYTSTRLYSEEEVQRKKECVTSFCREDSSASLTDYGTNNGEFSTFAAAYYNKVIAIDIDSICIDHLYLNQKSGEIPSNVVPLVQDLCNPSSPSRMESLREIGV